MSESPLLQEAIASYIIIMYKCMTDPGYLNLMAGYGYGCVSLARSMFKYPPPPGT